MRQQSAVLVRCRSHNMRSGWLSVLSVLARGRATARSLYNVLGQKSRQPALPVPTSREPARAGNRVVCDDDWGISQFGARIWGQVAATRAADYMFEPLGFLVHLGATRQRVRLHARSCCVEMLNLSAQGAFISAKRRSSRRSRHSRAVASKYAGTEAPQRRKEIAWERRNAGLGVAETLPYLNGGQGSRVPETTWTSS